MSKPVLYTVNASPPVRSVLITAYEIGLDLEKKPLSIFQGEQLSDEYLQINPQHTVPTLVDVDGTVVWDSHAIATYLITKYGGAYDSFYPAGDIVQRAKIDQRLHFDTGILFPPLRATVEALFLKGVCEIPADLLAKIEQAYAFLEAFLVNDDYLAGDAVTVADFCCIPTITSIAGVVPIDEVKFGKLASYVRRMEERPSCCEVNADGVTELVAIVNGLIEKNKAKL